MVLNANELETRVLQKESTKLHRTEKVLDEYLEQAFDGHRAIVGIPKEYYDLHELTRKDLLKKYENAGWNVKYQSDQRDGDFFEFTIRKTRTYNNKRDNGTRPDYLL